MPWPVSGHCYAVISFLSRVCAIYSFFTLDRKCLSDPLDVDSRSTAHIPTYSSLPCSQKPVYTCSSLFGVSAIRFIDPSISVSRFSHHSVVTMNMNHIVTRMASDCTVATVTLPLLPLLTFIIPSVVLHLSLV